MNGRLYSFFGNIYNKIRDYAFKINPVGNRMFQDLDDLIAHRDSFSAYIKFEYSLSIFYNVTLTIPSLIYLLIKFRIIFNCDYISTLWLLLVTIIKILEILPKSILIHQTIRISSSSNDPIVYSSRLMSMTRSNIFLINTILGYIMLISYTLYFLCIRKSNYCNDAVQFYYIINWLVFGFFIRLIISFVNYFLHFKYGLNEADLHNMDLNNYANRVPNEVLKMLESHTLGEENMDIVKSNNDKLLECSICLNDFEISHCVKILPCNKKHIFHSKCIDKWLSHNKACPICRQEVSKKSITKNKLY